MEIRRVHLSIGIATLIPSQVLSILIVVRNAMQKAVLVISFTGILLAACASAAGGIVTLAPMAMLPEAVLQAPEGVQEAYRYALANQDVLSQMPCYCGCGGVGHTSNFDCYVAETAVDDTITFDYHALG